jgi:hypothetical protein
VEPQGPEGTFGLACQIEDYRFNRATTEREH